MKNLFLCFAIVLVSCSHGDEPAELPAEKSIPDSIISPLVSTTVKTIIKEDGSSCTRGVPGSIIKKGAFKKMSFELKPNKLVAIETIDFENGDKLIIKDWGCDYYALTFRFETSRFQSEPTNIPFWYKRSVTLLNEINKEINARIDVVKGTDRLMNQIEDEVPNGYKGLALNKELDFEEGEIRSFVSIDKVEQLTDKKFAIEITFAKGPL